MAKLEIDVDGYITERERELTELDINHEPETEATESGEREKEAKLWLESRLEQLRTNKYMDLLELKKAWRSGYLSTRSRYEAYDRLHSLYTKLEEEARGLCAAEQA